MRHLLPFGDCLSVTGSKFFFNVEWVRMSMKSVSTKRSITTYLQELIIKYPQFTMDCNLPVLHNLTQDAGFHSWIFIDDTQP
jgi:hypothetical protein